ncbi:MAG TPA: pilus assembly PilX N-terminal domain-containing protein [Candidatus Eisenbacteria bacterium]|nr:pilus assembly PilX N-terminal domain-containing protein [Candidatus Eisenbacteria bacterium]
MDAQKSANPCTPLAGQEGLSLVVVLMVMAIMLSVVGAGLLFSGINTKIITNYQSGARAFNAADTGINAVTSSLALNPTFSATPVVLQQDTATNTVLCYRFGKRDGTVPSPQPVVRSEAGFSLGSGTGYNNSGYSFYQYQINVTGSFSTGTTCPSVGAELAAREVEAQAMYGPVPK